MENRRNVLLLVAAAVVLVIGFVMLKPGSSDDASTAADTVTAPATTVTTPATTPTATTPATTVTTAPAPPPATVIRVVGGEAVGGLKAINVKKGDQVRFEVVADAPEEVHAHGYDILKDVAPGKPARFSFKATLEGQFEIELEQSGTEIGKLTVSP